MWGGGGGEPTIGGQSTKLCFLFLGGESGAQILLGMGWASRKEDDRSLCFAEKGSKGSHMEAKGSILEGSRTRTLFVGSAWDCILGWSFEGHQKATIGIGVKTAILVHRLVCSVVWSV